jgi:hypothetical protein
MGGLPSTAVEEVGGGGRPVAGGGVVVQRGDGGAASAMGGRRVAGGAGGAQSEVKGKRSQHRRRWGGRGQRRLGGRRPKVGRHTGKVEDDHGGRTFILTRDRSHLRAALITSCRRRG